MPKPFNTIIAPIQSDGHTLSASPSLVVQFPPSYLQRPGSSKSARSTSLAPQYIFGEMPESVPVQGSLAALFGQFTSAAEVQIRLFSGAGRVGLVYDSGALPVAPKGGKWFLVFPTSVAHFRSYEILLTDPNNPVGYHQCSRLVVGEYFQPVINIEPDFSYQRNTTTSQKRLADGSLHAIAGGNFTDFSFTFAHLQDSERGKIDDFIGAVSLHRDFFMALMPTHGSRYDFASVVMFTETTALSYQKIDTYGASFGVSEALGGNVAVASLIIPPEPPIVIPPGQGGEGTENGYWTARLNDHEGVSSRYNVASDGEGMIVALRGQDTVQRSTDYGLTYTEFTVAGLLGTDIQWTGEYFCGCDAHGNMYYSADGINVETVANGVGFSLDRISGVGSSLLAAGEKIYGFDIATLTFTDYTTFASWGETGCAAMLYSADGQYIFFFSANRLWIYRYTVATGAMTAFVPTGISGTYQIVLYGYDHIAALMSDGNLYLSADGGVSFSLWLSPPPHYTIHDLILTRRPELLVVMERTDNDYRYRRIFDAISTLGFTELSVRISYAGRQMLIQESGRIIEYSLTNTSAGTLDAGINTNYVTVNAYRIESGEYIPVEIAYSVQNGVVTYTANPPFTGVVTLFTRNDVIAGAQ